MEADQVLQRGMGRILSSGLGEVRLCVWTHPEMR